LDKHLPNLLQSIWQPWLAVEGKRLIAKQLRKADAGYSIPCAAFLYRPCGGLAVCKWIAELATLLIGNRR